MSISLNLAWVIIISRSSSSLGDHVTRGPCPAKELGWAQLFRPPIGLTNRLWVSPMLPEAGDFINIFFSYMSYIYGRICLKDKKWSEKKLFVNFKTILRRFLGTCSWDFFIFYFLFTMKIFSKRVANPTSQHSRQQWKCKASSPQPHIQISSSSSRSLYLCLQTNMGVKTVSNEFSSSIPPKWLFKALILESHNLLPKLAPQTIKS